jgi:lysozyme
MSITTDYNNAIVQRDFWLAEVTRLSALLVKDGPDVSQFQGTVNWSQVASNSGFAFVRVADGDIRDTAYTGTSVAAIRQTTMPWAPYYFGRVASSGNNERNGRVEAGMAIHFATAGGWGKPQDLPLAYDFETLNGQTAEKAGKHLIQFVKTYEWIMQHKPIVYINPATANPIVPTLSPADQVILAACPLWIAHWGTMTPTVPQPWTDWTFHQYTNQGVAPGITGAVDLNRFSGSATDLNALRIS